MQWPTFSKSGMAMVPSFDLHTQPSTSGETSVDTLIALICILFFAQPCVGYV